MDRNNDEDKLEFARMMHKLAKLYPRHLDDDIVEEYFVALKGYSCDSISRGLANMREHRETNKFPAPGEIAKHIRLAPPKPYEAIPEHTPTSDDWKHGKLTFRWGRVRTARGLSLDGEEATSECEAFVKFYWDNAKMLEMTLDQVEAVQSRLSWPGMEQSVDKE